MQLLAGESSLAITKRRQAAALHTRFPMNLIVEADDESGELLIGVQFFGEFAGGVFG
jgi:hypothetical protein